MELQKKRKKKLTHMLEKINVLYYDLRNNHVCQIFIICSVSIKSLINVPKRKLFYQSIRMMLNSCLLLAAALFGNVVLITRGAIFLRAIHNV